MKRKEFLSQKEFLSFAQTPAPLGWGMAEEDARIHWRDETEGKRPITVKRAGKTVQLFKIQASLSFNKSFICTLCHSVNPSLD